MDRSAIFWRRVDRTSSGCWLWSGSRLLDGYGSLNIKGLPKRAHRASWFLVNGEIPRGTSVLHHCDNPPCVRPDHLFLGTQRENVADRHHKGRDGHSMGRPGESNANHKLTSDQVREIAARVASGETQEALAREFMVAQATISRIKHRRRWACVLEVSR